MKERSATKYDGVDISRYYTMVTLYYYY